MESGKNLQAFSSRRVVTPQGIREAAVLVEDGRILDIVPPSKIPPQIPVKDHRDDAILPGLVDSHVHINEPGRTEWEGFRTATRAAAASGYTMLVDMPLNCLPPTTTVAALEAKRKAAASQCSVDWMAWGGVVGDNQQHIADLAAAGVPGFKCFLIHPGIDGFTMVTEPELRMALPHLARTNLPLLVHAELPGPVEAATQKLEHADWTKYPTYLQSRPVEAELSAIQLLLSLCRLYRFRLHIVHLSTSRALDMLRAAKKEGLPVSVETCPHYLHFAAENIPDGATLFKCAPPIRGRENCEALWQGLREGVIDLVATDHSPCPPEMKHLREGNFRSAWGGISSLSLALPVTWTEASRRGFTLGDIARWMAEGPSKLSACHSRKAQIAKGYDSDLVVFDPEAEFIVTENHLPYRHRISPYLGERLRGVVKATYLRGNCVFADGAAIGSPYGREFRR
ncbi:MAG TPA: allantoinase AllB [Candidatus Udaeobacter sp.]|nr:allantoinase AllB [Candidatus Udaeobacter sp.]